MANRDRPPSVFRRLLVGVGEDRRSDHAVRAAVALAERWGADLELIHAVPVQQPDWMDLDRVRQAAATGGTLSHAWRALVEHLAADLADLSFGGRPLEAILRVLPGHPAQILLEQQRETEADLVVLGAHARRGLLDFGNTARAVLAKAECPVWVQVSPPAPVRRILVPVDLSGESLAVLQLARGLAAGLEAALTVLTCFDTPVSLSGDPGSEGGGAYDVVPQVRDAARRTLDALVARIPWEGRPPAVAFLPAEPVGEILRRQEECDLIVMGTHGRTRFSAAVLGSTAYAVLREARVPVLVLRRADQEWMV
ncbi:MAG: universal stress protein [Planctomycetota bacterium]